MHEVGIMETTIAAVLSEARGHDASVFTTSCFAWERYLEWNPTRFGSPSMLQ
jgi:hypothetical protein